MYFLATTTLHGSCSATNRTIRLVSHFEKRIRRSVLVLDNPHFFLVLFPSDDLHRNVGTALRHENISTARKVKIDPEVPLLLHQITE